MTIPQQMVPLPASVAELAVRHRLGDPVPAWANEIGGLTFSFPSAGQFVKWAPHHRELDLTAEAERMRWAAQWITVPQVLEEGSDEAGQWLRTRALPGDCAVDPAWLARPETAVRAIATGLRHLHDTLPVEGCPFDWSLTEWFRWIKRPEDRVLIDQAPSIDQLVVCHGDACAPNTLIGADGRYAGHVDLGHLGVADRWADLAIATYSLSWNFDGDWEPLFLETYGIDRDDERISYYRRLWDAT